MVQEVHNEGDPSVGLVTIEDFLGRLYNRKSLMRLMLFLTLTNKTDRRINMKLSSFNNQLSTVTANLVQLR